MKRSEINRYIVEAKEFLEEQNFRLPPFAFCAPEDWALKAHGCEELRANGLGWDVTDFGRGDFEKFGLVLFTIRNGNQRDKKWEKPYAEKVLLPILGQMTPMHFHWTKMEDIINRGGGNLIMKVYNATEDDKLADTPVEVAMDGVARTVPAGTELVVEPGESVTVPRRLFHAFWSQEGMGKVLIGEVSSVNDDEIDNCFIEPIGRFPKIEEDESPVHLLCIDYGSSGAYSGD